MDGNGAGTKSVKKDALNTAIAGKAIERGLTAQIAEGQVFVQYGEPVDDATDHLHRQVIRNLVYRLIPDSVCHIYTVDGGFRVQVNIPERRPDNKMPDQEWVSQLSAEERLALIRQLVA